MEAPVNDDAKEQTPQAHPRRGDATGAGSLSTSVLARALACSKEEASAALEGVRISWSLGKRAFARDMVTAVKDAAVLFVEGEKR